MLLSPAKKTTAAEPTSSSFAFDNPMTKSKSLRIGGKHKTNKRKRSLKRHRRQRTRKHYRRR